MDDSSVSGRNPTDDPPAWPELKTDNVMVALVAQLRFAIVKSWLPPEEATS